MKHLVVWCPHLCAYATLEFDNCKVAWTGIISVTNVDVGSIPPWVNVAQEEHEKRPIVVLEQIRKRSAGVPLHGKLNWNGMRFVLRCCEGALRFKQSLLRRGELLKLSTLMLRRESLHCTFEPYLGGLQCALKICYGDAC